MEKTFWSDAARYGAYVGLLLAASSVLETGVLFSGKIGLYAIIMIEWLAVAVLHFYLLLRFTRRRSALAAAADGFSFGEGYGYVLSMSLPAGLLLGVVNYIFLHLVLGYGNYVDKIGDIFARLAGKSGMTVPWRRSSSSSAIRPNRRFSPPSWAVSGRASFSGSSSD